MGFTFGYCDLVRANRVYLNRIARDGFNASNCANVAVTDCDFEWIIDDCCAANLSAGEVGDFGQQRTFTFLGNHVFQCPGRQAARRQACADRRQQLPRAVQLRGVPRRRR